MSDTPSTTATVAGLSGMLTILALFKDKSSLDPTYIGRYDWGEMGGVLR